MLDEGVTSARKTSRYFYEDDVTDDRVSIINSTHLATTVIVRGRVIKFLLLLKFKEMPRVVY